MKTFLPALVLLSALATSARAQPAPDATWRGRGSAVVVDREDLERRLSHLEMLLRESERGRRGEEQGRLNEAFQELAGLRQWISRAPDARDSSWTPSRPPPPSPPPAPMRSAVSDGRLRDILATMSREAFSSDKLRVLEMASRGDYFLVSQVSQALSQFPSSGDRLSVVRLLWPRVLDRQNAYQLNEAFPFSSDKQELQRIISG